jgi:hypothetical protein
MNTLLFLNAAIFVLFGLVALFGQDLINFLISKSWKKVDGSVEEHPSWTGNPMQRKLDE